MHSSERWLNSRCVLCEKVGFSTQNHKGRTHKYYLSYTDVILKVDLYLTSCNNCDNFIAGPGDLTRIDRALEISTSNYVDSPLWKVMND